MSRAEKIATIVGVTEAIKQYGIPSKYCPTIAILVGAALEYAENPTSDGLLYGIMLGATVTGGYAVVKRSSNAVLDSDKPKFSELEHDDIRI